MKTCPRCGIGNIRIEQFLQANPTPVDISGKIQQVGFSATPMAVVTCSHCSLNVTGRLEGATLGPGGVFTGGHFVEVRDGGHDS